MNTKEFTLSIQSNVDAELGRVRLLKVSESIKLLQLIFKLSSGTLNTKGKTSKGVISFFFFLILGWQNWCNAFNIYCVLLHFEVRYLWKYLLTVALIIQVHCSFVHIYNNKPLDSKYIWVPLKKTVLTLKIGEGLRTTSRFLDLASTFQLQKGFCGLKDFTHLSIDIVLTR